ncbi:YdcF family protein [Ferrimonas futtsuensis]|uniref:YdcF family protein n=1 Tax=Ferrimonas futtsuensis TaxID=364764 RepID=UPI000404BED8|nr:ElyC/SanA/YdcF family protein [Ferrimonas futtsuensis]
MVGFWIKKGISALLLPIPLAVLLILFGLWLSRSRSRLGRAFVLMGPALMLFLSSSFGSQWLARPLEQQYPVWSGQGAEVIMVLGSGHDSSISPMAHQQLSDTALARLTEGVRLQQLYPGSTLVLSGWGGEDPLPHAQVAAAAAQGMGVPAEQIVTFPTALDTAMEARLFRERFGEREVILVSSATHMPRVMALFLGQGVQAQAAPTDFIGRGASWWQFSASNLQTSERALHEYLGLLWCRWASL